MIDVLLLQAYVITVGPALHHSIVEPALHDVHTAHCTRHALLSEQIAIQCKDSYTCAGSPAGLIVKRALSAVHVMELMLSMSIMTCTR